MSINLFTYCQYGNSIMPGRMCSGLQSRTIGTWKFNHDTCADQQTTRISCLSKSAHRNASFLAPLNPLLASAPTPLPTCSFSAAAGKEKKYSETPPCEVFLSLLLQIAIVNHQHEDIFVSGLESFGRRS